MRGSREILRLLNDYLKTVTLGPLYEREFAAFLVMTDNTTSWAVNKVIK